MLIAAVPIFFLAVQLVVPAKFGCTYFGEDFVSIAMLLTGVPIEAACGPHPVALYLPGFLLPLWPFTLPDPHIGFTLWTLANIGLVFWIAYRLKENPLLLLGFFPVTIGLLQGQIHIIQLLALTEALRSTSSSAKGLWLSFQAVKPQYAPFFALYLAYKRDWKALGWMSIGVVIWLALGGFRIPSSYPTSPILAVLSLSYSLALVVPFLGSHPYKKLVYVAPTSLFAAQFALSLALGMPLDPIVLWTPATVLTVVLLALPLVLRRSAVLEARPA